jgi:hypothetical protein
MSGADEAEASQTRAGSNPSGSGGDPQDLAAVNADTQLIPVIESEASIVDASDPAAASRAVEAPNIERARSESPRVDESTVRAVARRAAAALPTLGGDGPREVPVSAKTTVERRRRAQGGLSPEESTAEPAANATPDPSPGTGRVAISHVATGPISAGSTATGSVGTGSTAGSMAGGSVAAGFIATPRTDEGAPLPPLGALLGQPAARPGKHSVATQTAAEPAKNSDAAKPDAAADAAKPEAAMDAAEPEAAMDAAEPEAAMDAAKPEAAMDAAKPEAAMDAAKPEAAMDAAKPEAAADAAKPDGAARAAELDAGADAAKADAAAQAAELDAGADDAKPDAGADAAPKPHGAAQAGKSHAATQAAKPDATGPESIPGILPFPPVPEPPMVNRPAALGPLVARPAVEDSQVDTVVQPIVVAAAPVPGDAEEWAPPHAQANDAFEIFEPAASDLARPGPPLLEADSWNAPPDTDRENDLYQGKRRATIPWKRIVLIVALVAGVGGLFAIPVALTNSSPNRPAVSSGDPIVIGGVGVPSATNEARELVSAASSPGSRPSARATKSPAPGSSAVPGGSAVPGTAGTAVPPTSAPAFTTTTPPQAPPPAPFATLTLQAEDATVSGSWQIVENNPACTAGTAMVRTGRWNARDGLLTFKFSIATAGSYKMRIYFAVQGDPRRAEITVNNASVATPDFPSACTPLGVRDVEINLNQGNNEITFANKRDMGPSIDRIEISKP